MIIIMMVYLKWLDKYERVFYIVFLILWITGLAGKIISPIIGAISSGLINIIGMMFGINI